MKIKKELVNERIRRGWDELEALTTPNDDRYKRDFGYELNGQIKTLKEWSDLYRINSSTVYQRIKDYGWTLENALTTPANRTRGTLITYNGETLNLKGWGEHIGIDSETVSKYLKKGFTMEEIINKFTN